MILKKCLILLAVLLSVSHLAHAQDDEMIFPETQNESIIPPNGDASGSTPPVIIDEDANDVSDVEEYDG